MENLSNRDSIIQDLEKTKNDLDSVSSTLILINESIENGQDISLLIPSILDGVIARLEYHRDKIALGVIPQMKQ